MTSHALRTSLALRIAPWLKPKEKPREWKITGLPRQMTVADVAEVAERFPTLARAFANNAESQK